MYLYEHVNSLWWLFLNIIDRLFDHSSSTPHSLSFSFPLILTFQSLNRLLKQMKRWSTSKASALFRKCLPLKHAPTPHSRTQSGKVIHLQLTLSRNIILLLLRSAGPLKLFIYLFIVKNNNNNKHIPSSHCYSCFLVLLVFVGCFLFPPVICLYSLSSDHFYS